jgi:hypothetical protein
MKDVKQYRCGSEGCKSLVIRRLQPLRFLSKAAALQCYLVRHTLLTVILRLAKSSDNNFCKIISRFIGKYAEIHVT